MKDQRQAGAPTTYPLGSLFASKDDNARKKERTPESVRRMAMSIHAHGGLLQNLVVVPEIKNGKRTGRAAVVAGETRRLGLAMLRDGAIPDAAGYGDDFLVPVIEVEQEQATVASATENVLREQMHPADQFEAFKKLNDQCGSVEHVAAVFGVEPQAVVRSLKLASASPKLFDLYRADGMKLEQLMALSITDDHRAQERVWAAAKGREWMSAPQQLRQALTEREVSTKSSLARWVGVKVYEAEGGAVRRDLFAEDGAGYVMDVELLRRLATDKLEKAASAVRGEGWAWVEVRFEAAYGDMLAFGRAAEPQRPKTDAERARWAPEVLALAGAIVAIDDGKAAIHRGLVRPEDKKAMKKAVAPTVAASGGVGGGGSAPAPKSGVSDALARSLTAHRTVALQRVMAANAHVALAALAHNMAQSLILGERARSALGLDARGCEAEARRFGDAALPESRAWRELQAMRSEWAGQMPADAGDLLPWLVALPMDRLCELLALCAALTVDVIAGDAKPRVGDALAAAAGLDMADWWEPTADNFLSRAPKAQALEAVAESVSERAAAALAPLKKDRIVAEAAALIAGRRWLPAILRTRAA